MDTGSITDCSSVLAPLGAAPRPGEVLGRGGDAGGDDLVRCVAKRALEPVAEVARLAEDVDDGGQVDVDAAVLERLGRILAGRGTGRHGTRIGADLLGRLDGIAVLDAVDLSALLVGRDEEVHVLARQLFEQRRRG